MKLTNLLKKKTKLVLGLMSGTSCDGLDMVLVQISNYGIKTRYKLRAGEQYTYDKATKDFLNELISSPDIGLNEISQANFFLAQLWSEAVLQFLANLKINPSEVDLIGSHGQTVLHHPDQVNMLKRPVRSTLQIGDPAVIAQLTGIFTIGDFRVADMAVGGQGAPLVPYFDWLSFASRQQSALILNIGGIANFTYIPNRSDPGRVIAFDTGPGNTLIDNMMRRLYEKPFDRAGKIATTGRFSQRLFDYIVKTDLYLDIPPPKSTGREYYNDHFVIGLLRKAVRWRIPEPDVIHTITKYTAYAVWRAHRDYIKSEIQSIIVSGGGVHNTFLMSQLADYFPGVAVQPAEQAGIDSDFKEAMCFAVLANECVHGSPASLPSVTGAKHPVVLGKMCPV
jgi:anhydro-N-acetylmuramic acid kinase